MTLETYVTYILPSVLFGIGVFGVMLTRLSARRSRRQSRRELVLSVVQAQQPFGTGYTLTKEVERRLGRFRPLAEIYSILAALQRERIVSSRWGHADTVGGPRHHYYWITADHPELKHDGGLMPPRSDPSPTPPARP